MVGNVILYVSAGVLLRHKLTPGEVLPPGGLPPPAIPYASISPASRNSPTPPGQRHVPP
jgi:hypothetical protein